MGQGSAGPPRRVRPAVLPSQDRDWFPAWFRVRGGILAGRSGENHLHLPAVAHT